MIAGRRSVVRGSMTASSLNGGSTNTTSMMPANTRNEVTLDWPTLTARARASASTVPPTTSFSPASRKSVP